MIGAMSNVKREQLEAGIDHVGDAPQESGRIELLVRRPAVEEREVLTEGELNLDSGLAGDVWPDRPASRMGGRGPDPEAQVTVMNARATALFADTDDHAEWAWAGDQIYVDFDLSKGHLPAGTRLTVGAAVLEVTAEPHLGCGKFSRRFGVDALKVVNSERGREMRLRGLNAKVIEPGALAVGDEIRKLS
jgi:hypothetical protein